MASTVIAAELPAGLTHPLDGCVRPRRICYRHGHTFTWIEGDRLVAVQRGRVANARMVHLLNDPHPKVEVIIGWVEVIGTVPVSPTRWNQPNAISALADAWADKHLKQPCLPSQRR